jgi:hypothetical protein
MIVERFTVFAKDRIRLVAGPVAHGAEFRSLLQSRGQCARSLRPAPPVTGGYA